MTEITARKSVRLSALIVVHRLIQWISLFFIGEWAFYGIFRCPFVIPFVSCQNCPILTCPGRIAHTYWGVWAGWLALLIMLGRSFCGWICPGGLIGRLFSKSPTCRDVHPQTAPAFSLGKYLALFCCIVIYFVVNQPRVNVPIRVGEFWPAVAQTFQYAQNIWLFRSALVLGLLALGLFISMAWCRFLCPMGGLLELLKRFSLFAFAKNSDCNNCNACRRVCPMQTRPGEANCTNCGECLSVCPSKSIHLRSALR